MIGNLQSQKELARAIIQSLNHPRSSAQLSTDPNATQFCADTLCLHKNLTFGKSANCLTFIGFAIELSNCQKGSK